MNKHSRQYRASSRFNLFCLTESLECVELGNLQNTRPINSPDSCSSWFIDHKMQEMFCSVCLDPKDCVLSSVGPTLLYWGGRDILAILCIAARHLGASIVLSSWTKPRSFKLYLCKTGWESTCHISFNNMGHEVLLWNTSKKWSMLLPNT